MTTHYTNSKGQPVEIAAMAERIVVLDAEYAAESATAPGAA